MRSVQVLIAFTYAGVDRAVGQTLSMSETDAVLFVQANRVKYLDTAPPPDASISGALNVQFDTDATLSANSDVHVPSQKAVKSYVDAAAAGAPGAVSSVNSRTGAVTLAASDVGLGSVTNVAQLAASALDADATMAANSDAKVPSQKAAKAYTLAGVAAAEAYADAGLAGKVSTSRTVNGHALSSDVTLAGSDLADLLGNWSFTGLVFPNATVSYAYIRTGDVNKHDIYTVPANRKAIVCGKPLAFNDASGGTIVLRTWIKIGSIYYPFNGSSNVNQNNASTVNVLGYVFAAGEIFAVSSEISTGNGFPCNFWLPILEFDATSPVKTVHIAAAAMSAGDNTVYTCPTGKTALVCNPTGNSGIVANNAGHANASGGNIAIFWNAVASGGSPSTSNKLAAPNNTADKSAQMVSVPPILNAGDFLSINVAANTADQLAWVTVLER